MPSPEWELGQLPESHRDGGTGGWAGACSPSHTHRPSLHCQGSFITCHDKAICSCSSPEPSALPFQNSHHFQPLSIHPLPINECSPARQCCSAVITQHFTEAAHYKILWLNEHPSFVSQEMYRITHAAKWIQRPAIHILLPCYSAKLHLLS